MKHLVSIVCTVAVMLTAGCTSIHTSVVLYDAPPLPQQLVIAKRGSGFGSGGYVTNAYWGGDVIKLVGNKTRYETGEFEFAGEHSAWTEKATGFIVLDRTNKTAEIAIRIDGQPYEFNGHYRL